MPNRNGTGPDGQGPNTGRGLGPCSPNQPDRQRPNPPYQPGRGPRNGFGRRIRGFGRNLRRGRQ